MKTKDILAKQRSDRRHPLDPGGDGRVSSSSYWTDMVWDLDPDDARFQPSDCRIYFPDLPEPLLNLLKTLLWSLMVARPDAKPLAISSAKRTASRLENLCRWMNGRGLKGLAEIVPAHLDLFRADLIEGLKVRMRANEHEEYDTSHVASFLMPLEYAHQQSRALAARGLTCLAEPPFGMGSAWQAAERMMPEVDGFMEPLPDEVVLRIIPAAYSFLGAPARDIMALAAICMQELGDERSRPVVNRSTHKKLLAFRFSTREGEDQPWHPPIAEYLARDDALANGKDLVRRLMSHLLAACVIIVRFHTGIRHAEMFSVLPGMREDGLPSCVETEPSISGAYLMYFLNGVVSKGWDHPEEARWLIAGTPHGADALPKPVEALITIESLLAPWRAWADREEIRDEFVLQVGWKALPLKPELVTPMTSEKLGLLMQNFIVDNAGLDQLDASDERLARYVPVDGRTKVQSRQWRKTWANFVVRVDKRLVPAIAQQFKHVSDLITEHDYIGTDIEQLGLVRNASLVRATRYVRDVLDGTGTAGGGMRRMIRAGMDDLKAKLAGLTGAAQDPVIRTWLVERDVHVWFAPHGACYVGLLPNDSRCHAAAGTLDWSNQTPSFAERCPRLCSGCPAFAMDEDDAPFWIERFLANRSIWRKAQRRGVEADYWIARERAAQARMVLASIDIDANALED